MFAAQSQLFDYVFSFGQGDCGRSYCPDVPGRLEPTTGQSKEEKYTIFYHFYTFISK